MPALLELRNLSKHFPTHRAVDRISLEIKRGEFFALLGPSGCGKTTTLRMIAGFEQPTEGEILLSGQSIQHLKPYQRNINTVFQNYALFPHLTVQQNVEFGLRRTGAKNIEKRTREVLELVRLTGKEARMPAQISGGERQRVALARSLVLAPEVLLLDEPLSALDPILRKQLRSELKALQRRVGITFLFVTHDQEEALSMSDRIGVMQAGILEQVGSAEEVYLRPRTRFVAGFLGAMNWFGNRGVRPESVRVVAGPPANGSIIGATFLGNVLHIQGRLDDGQAILAEMSRMNGSFAPGERVHFSWLAEDEVRFENTSIDGPKLL
jgi:ABC-type Fe3+/spermidine/putrescine transport system ATPase subunit